MGFVHTNYLKLGDLKCAVGVETLSGVICRAERTGPANDTDDGATDGTDCTSALAEGTYES